MGIKIQVVGDTPTTLTTTQDEQRAITVSTVPVTVTGQQAQSVAIEILKGAPGDDRVFVGDTPPDNPQEGQIWIDTSGG